MKFARNIEDIIIVAKMTDNSRKQLHLKFKNGYADSYTTSLSFDPMPPGESFDLAPNEFVLRCKFDAFKVDVTDLDSNSIINGCDAGGKIGGWTITE